MIAAIILVAFKIEGFSNGIIFIGIVILLSVYIFAQSALDISFTTLTENPETSSSNINELTILTM